MELKIRAFYLIGKTARRPIAAIAAVGLLLWSGAQVHAQDLAADVCPSNGLRQVRLANFLSGDSFLTRDNEEVRLAGILAPSLDGGLGTEAGIAASKAFLEQTIGDESIFLAFTGPERDRYGRLSAQAFVSGRWLQGAMLEAGLARAAPDILTRECAASLLDAESNARARQAGLWMDGDFAILRNETLLAGEERFAGSFQIVEAVIVDVGDYRGRYFLNFGEDRETDFTVTISPQDMRYFRQSDYDLNSLVGRRVRVRGWLESYNGPNMPISIPEVIEFVQ